MAATLLPGVSAGLRAQSPRDASSGSVAASSAVSMPGLGQPESPFLGSVPSGQRTPEVLHLTVKEALERGLQYNLGLLLSEQDSRSARAARWNALSRLLPHAGAHVTETEQQINLQAFGFPGIPGIPTIVGPFSVFDARGSVSQSVFDWSAYKGFKSAAASQEAVRFTYQDARELVVLVVGNAYLLAEADQARVEAAEAEAKTAQALYEKARDMLKAGLTPAIDEMRAHVELQSRQQQLIVARNELAKQKLSLARAIGLPPGQEFDLATRIPYAPYQPPSLEDELRRAYTLRADYQSALARKRAAELALKSARAERYPTIAFSGDYGDIGLAPGRSHGTFTAAGTLRIPIFEGGRIRADILAADAALQRRQSELDDLRAKIDQQVRTARLDLEAAADQVQVAKSQLDLAQQTLAQAQDRFAAGVADNLEVVQAQDAVASANEAYISSLYSHNVAKVLLARAVGVAEQAVTAYLGGK